MQAGPSHWLVSASKGKTEGGSLVSLPNLPRCEVTGSRSCCWLSHPLHFAVCIMSHNHPFLSQAAFSQASGCRTKKGNQYLYFELLDAIVLGLIVFCCVPSLLNILHSFPWFLQNSDSFHFTGKKAARHKTCKHFLLDSLPFEGYIGQP